MVDISNKALALVLVVAVVVSIGGTLISLNKLDAFTVTGLPIQDAIASLEIEGSIAIDFVVDAVNFGSGYAIPNASAGITTCDITTDGVFNTTGYCFGFEDNLDPFLLRNIGNTAVQLDIEFSQNAAGFITGTGAELEFYIENEEALSCSAGLAPAAFANVNNQTICTTFNHESSNDEINIHLRALIPADAQTGVRTNTVTVTAYN